MKTKKNVKKQLTLYDKIIENKRLREKIRTLRSLTKEKKERLHQNYRAQLKQSSKKRLGALGACGAIAAGISPFPRSIDLTAIVL